MSNSDHDDGGGWEAAPTRQSKKKSSSGANKEPRNARGNRGGGGSRRGQGRGGGGGGGGFGGWAKPKPNADWPSPPQSHYTSQQSEMLMVSRANAVGSGGSGAASGGKELTYLDAVPKRELTEPTLTCSADSLLQQQAAKDGDNATSSATATAAASTFQSMLKKTSLTDLMADYGKEDKDFAKMVVPQQQQEDNASKPNT